MENFVAAIYAATPANRQTLMAEAWEAERVAHQQFVGGGVTPPLRRVWQEKVTLRRAVCAAVAHVEQTPKNTPNMKRQPKHTLSLGRVCEAAVYQYMLPQSIERRKAMFAVGLLYWLCVILGIAWMIWVTYRLVEEQWSGRA